MALSTTLVPCATRELLQSYSRATRRLLHGTELLLTMLGTTPVSCPPAVRQPRPASHNLCSAHADWPPIGPDHPRTPRIHLARSCGSTGSPPGLIPKDCHLTEASFMTCSGGLCRRPPPKSPRANKSESLICLAAAEYKSPYSARYSCFSSPSDK